MFKLLLRHTRRPDISFDSNGTIRITARLARLLDLAPGDSLNVAVRDDEYLLHALPAREARGRRQARCYPTKKGSSNFCANSVRLARAVLHAAAPTLNHAAFLTGEPLRIDGTLYVPIITRSPMETS